MNIKELLKKLDNLYTKTEMDWDLNINICFTEPVCPSISIQPEGMQITRYITWCDYDNIEQKLEELVDRVYREIMLGEVVESSAPFSNPDDERFELLLAKWRETGENNA